MTRQILIYRTHLPHFVIFHIKQKLINSLLKTASTQFNNLVKWNTARNCVSKKTLITFGSRLRFYDFPLVFTKTQLN